MRFFILGIFLTTLAFAHNNDLSHRPKSFNTSMGKAVFVDFFSAEYDIDYDISKKTAAVKATIKFYAPEAGYPIFDSYETPVSVVLNGESVTAQAVSTPSKETTVRVMNKSVSIGRHTAIISVPLVSLTEYNSDGVKSAFWTSDLTERKFLERYMPANLEYDQVKMYFNVSFSGGNKKQVIYTNGEMREIAPNTFKISYPKYFNASSIFFHTVPEGATDELRFSVKSVDGRNIPAVVYVADSVFTSSRTLEHLKNETTKIFHELEGDYGAWPHHSIIVYNAGSGGMEYCGATITSLRALGHEMFHFYFARGVMPANGNAGWLDEALASWRDEGYQSSSSMSGTSMMSAHPYYTRTTDRAAYSFGERFMRYLDGKLKSSGGLKPFLRHMVDKKLFAPLFVEDFIAEMGEYYGFSLEGEFKKYTFDKRNNFSPMLKSQNPEIHRKMTMEELKELL